MAKKVKQKFIGSTFACNVSGVKFELTESLTKTQINLIESTSPKLLEDVKTRKKASPKQAEGKGE